jgi:dihydroorotase
MMSVNPARILRVPGGSLAPGSVADITVLAPDMPVRIDAKALRSKSKNTPFDGWELRGEWRRRSSEAARSSSIPR